MGNGTSFCISKVVQGFGYPLCWVDPRTMAFSPSSLLETVVPESSTGTLSSQWEKGGRGGALFRTFNNPFPLLSCTSTFSSLASLYRPQLTTFTSFKIFMILSDQIQCPPPSTLPFSIYISSLKLLSQVLLWNASSHAQCTVRPNRLKCWSLKQRKIYCRAIQGDR